LLPGYQALKFPPDVQNAMGAGGAAATCVPVKLDSNAWETAIFFHLAGPESRQDRDAFARCDATVPVSVEADLIEHAKAAVVTIRCEVFTCAEDPLIGEILLTPGHVSAHFEALKLLATQPRLCWFFGDQHFEVLHSQQHALAAEQHASFDDLLREAVKHDSLIRCTGVYDAEAAVSEIVSHYELRAGAPVSENSLN
jgi:hypothetical protein